MNEPTPPADDLLANASREEILSALFANMVIQQTNMAMMLLGKVPHPETGQHIRDLDAAKMFIDQLEMIEVKTKGNLDQREQALLKQALAALRMTFVEEVDAPAAPAPSAQAASPEPAAPPAPEAKPAPAPAPAEAPAAGDESRKKFSKKY
jgi:nucleoid-associated protein YgaU